MGYEFMTVFASTVNITNNKTYETKMVTLSFNERGSIFTLLLFICSVGVLPQVSPSLIRHGASTYMGKMRCFPTCLCDTTPLSLHHMLSHNGISSPVILYKFY